MKQLTIISGDPSSDSYAFDLVSRLRQEDDAWQISGIGGPKLRSLAPDVLDYQPLCVVGLVEIFKHIRSIWSLRRRVLADLEKAAPHTVLLLDCPGFNMSLLSRLSHKHHIIYAIPPQLWAWHEGRVAKLKRFCQEVWVIYPFEVEFYRQHGLETRLLRHPLVEKLHLCARPLLKASQPMTVALLPGSRNSEHQHLMPYYLRLAKARPQIDWVWVEHQSGSLSRWYDEMQGRIVVGLPELPPVHAAVATSGTVTLELALMRIPAVVIYKVARVTAFIARLLIRIAWVSLPNILLGECVYPELIQDKLSDEALLGALERLLGTDTADTSDAADASDKKDKIKDNARELQYRKLGRIRQQLDQTSPSLSDCMMDFLAGSE